MTKLLLLLSLVILSLFLPLIANSQANQSITNGQKTNIVNFPGGGCVYKWTNDQPGIGLAASGTGDITSFTAVNTGTTPVIATISAMPVPSGYAYITNSGSNNVSVVSIALQTVVATIKVGANPYGVSVNPDGSLVYITNKDDNTVSVINTITNKVTANISVGRSPTGIVVSPDGKRVYVANYGDNTVSVIDAVTNSVSATINVGLEPYGIAVSPDGTKIYVTNYKDGTVSVINPALNNVAATFNVGQGPTGIAVSPDNSIVYVSNSLSKTVSAVNAVTNATIKSVSTLERPMGIVVSPDGTKAYLSDNGYIAIVYALYNYSIAEWADSYGPGISITPDGSLVYIPNNGDNTLDYIKSDITTGGRLIVGKNPICFGNFIGPNLNCQSGPVTFTITVNPTVVNTGVVTGTISACAGTASVSPEIQQFTVTATGLSNNVTVTAPTGFEISLTANTGYAGNLVIPQAGGVINAGTTVYVRSSSTAAAGTISGNVLLSTPGTTITPVPVKATINSLPGINTVADQSVFNGDLTTAVNFNGTGNGFTWVNDNPAIGLAATGTGDIASFQAINTGNTTVKATITVTPVSAGHAYITNSYDGTVSVINTNTNTVETTIKVGSGPTGVAYSPDGKKVYITNSGSGTVSVINTTNNAVLSTFQAGPFPGGIAISPDGNTIFVVNSPQMVYTKGSVTVISAVTGNLIATIETGDNPVGIVLSPDGSKAYVTNSIAGTVSVINTQNNSITTTISLSQILSGLAISPDGKLIYVVNDYSGRVHVVSTITNAIVANITVGSQASEIAVSPDGTKAYVTNFLDHTISVINTAKNIVVKTIPVGRYPYGVSVTSDGNWVYVTNSSSNTVSVINANTNVVQATVNVGSNPNSFGNFITPGTGCTGQPVTFTITVKPKVPTITAGVLSGNISACAGTPSSDPNLEQLTVSGDFLSTDITATTTAGFEISLSPSGSYSTSLNLPQTGGAIAGTNVYVRSTASAPTGHITGTLAFNSTGAQEQDIPVSGVVDALPSINPISSQTVMNGQMTTAVSFSGVATEFDWINDAPSIGLPASGSGDIAAFTGINIGNTPVKATIRVTPKSVGRAYITNTYDGTVSVINTNTNAVETTINVGLGPYGVAYSPDAKEVYITNGGSGTISVINTASNTVSRTFKAVTTAESIALLPDGSKMFVVNYSQVGTKGSVSVIDAATGNTITTINVGINPGDIVLSLDGAQAYVSNTDGTISIINTQNNSVVKTISFTKVLSGEAISADGKLLYVVNHFTGEVYVVNTATYATIATITVGAQPSKIVISPDGTKAYVTNSLDNTISVINTATNVVIKTIPVGLYPYGISTTSDGSLVYVSNSNSNTVSIISAATNAVQNTIKVGAHPLSAGNFITPGSSCDGLPVTFTITVTATPKPFITTIAATGIISACEGNASTSPNIQQFTVSGGNLAEAITASAPAGFELSFDASGNYSGSLTIAATAGIVNTTTVYVRSSALAPAGNISGEVTLSSTGAKSQQVAVTGIIAGTPIVNAIMNKVFVNATVTAPIVFTGTAAVYNWTNDNPAIGLVASGTGALPSFTPVNISTTPVMATIVVAPFNSAGCPGQPTTFTIAVYPVPPSITIPNAFTPNGDGINDTWHIKYLSDYLGVTVNVFNRWGQNLFSSIGYGVDWDGNYKGTPLPAGTYYYVINLHNGKPVISGWVAIIR